VFVAQIGNRRAGLRLFQDANDLVSVYLDLRM
jgi:hypothetical protein